MDRAEERLAHLPPLPQPFTAESLAAALAEQRGRAIIMRPLLAAGPGLPCGLWLAFPTWDLVCYAADGSALLREQIKLHELAHMICDHRGDLDDTALAAMLPGCSPRLVRRKLGAQRVSALGRTSYTNAQEQEAEMLATFIAERAAEEPLRADRLLISLADRRPPRRREETP
ncbi:hypothetical protein ABIA33_004700 [Streptacidiphilus sp. MAP12-16]|jgi:hypothetical protein|uniref:ParH-like protein n=1 Tax=Streptacidiphilus sp. MAP12-16 TaxID=3156300 RepID=UPI003517259C